MRWAESVLLIIAITGVSLVFMGIATGLYLVGFGCLTTALLYLTKGYSVFNDFKQQEASNDQDLLRVQQVLSFLSALVLAFLLFSTCGYIFALKFTKTISQLGIFFAVILVVVNWIVSYERKSTFFYQIIYRLMAFSLITGILVTFSGYVFVDLKYKDDPVLLKAMKEADNAIKQGADDLLERIQYTDSLDQTHRERMRLKEETSD